MRRRLGGIVSPLGDRVGRLRRRRRVRGMVLMFHGVGQVAADPWELFVAPSTFTSYLATIRHWGLPHRLTELALGCRSGGVTDRSVVLTFDDGYANNLHFALPALERYEVPATVFIISGAIGAGREFWWDELEQLILGPHDLPSKLEPEHGLPAIALGPASSYPVLDQRTDRLAARELAPPSPRLALYRCLWQALVDMTPECRAAALVHLQRWAGIGLRLRESHRPLTESELRTLAAHPLIDIGAHTVHHPMLPRLAVEQQIVEIAESTTRIEAITATRVRTFSYPFGASDQATVEAVAAVGLQIACSTKQAVCHHRTAPLLIPRFDVKDRGTRGFGRQLDAWYRA